MPEKIKGQTADGKQRNLERLVQCVAELFPAAVIEQPFGLCGQGQQESQNAASHPAPEYKHVINWQALGELVGLQLTAEAGVSSSAREPFGFFWSGKRAAVQESTCSISKALRPCIAESKDWDSTGNLYVEGDNLEVLKLLQGSYLANIKMIYIDPPYNTGNDSFVYHDDFTQSREEYAAEAGLIDEGTGARMVANSSTDPRYHSQWCSMLYARLLLARSFLRSDGVIFISIDDHEQHHLREICDEVFGERNFVAQFIWQRAFSPKNDAKYVSTSHDYVLMYARNIDAFTIGRLPFTEEAKARYKNPDNDPRGPWTSGDLSVKTYNKSYDYPITTPTGREVRPPKGSCWRVSKERFAELLADNRIVFGKDGNGSPMLKRFLSERKREGMTPTSLLLHEMVGHSKEGAQELNTLMDGRVFDGPKPVRLIRHLMTLANLDPQGSDIVLDFFSGSATTAEAVMRANAEDGGNRRFILVQFPEQCAPDSPYPLDHYRNICEIGKERIRRAAAAIASQVDCTKIVHGGGTRVLDKSENAESPILSSFDADLDQQIKTDNINNLGADTKLAANSESASTACSLEDLDLGFRVFKVSSSNFLPSYFQVDSLSQDMLSTLEGNIKSDRSDLDLLFECVLDWHLPLSYPFKIQRVAGHQVYDYNDGDLLACFETDVGESFVHSLAQRELKPLRVVMRDSCFQDSASKINLSELFKTLLPEVQLRVL